MNIFQLTMKILSALIMVYFLLVMIRIMLTWLPTISSSSMKIQNFIRRVTEPYFRHFHGIPWLRFGVFDFSPILGLTILSFLLYLTQELSSGRFPSLGMLLVWIFSAIWSIFAFILLILGLLMLVRLFTLYVLKNNAGLMQRLDRFLFPLVSKILAVFTHKTVTYPLALGLSAASLLLLRYIIGMFFTRFLIPILLRF